MGTCALVGASDFNAWHFRARHEAGAFDLVAAVDGGFDALVSAGVDPDVALGDFDSLGRVPEGLPVVRLSPEKDWSDMEYAMDYVFDRGYADLVAYGALGRRLDHTLANLQLFARLSERGAQVEAVGMDAALRFLTGPATLELTGPAEGTVSVFSLSDRSCGVDIRGMRYVLEDGVLTNRTTRGLSNELQGRPASVSVREGTLCVFCPLP